jgi:hypothetical protein
MLEIDRKKDRCVVIFRYQERQAFRGNMHNKNTEALVYVRWNSKYTGGGHNWYNFRQPAKKMKSGMIYWNHVACSWKHISKFIYIQIEHAYVVSTYTYIHQYTHTNWRYPNWTLAVTYSRCFTIWVVYPIWSPDVGHSGPKNIEMFEILNDTECTWYTIHIRLVVSNILYFP